MDRDGGIFARYFTSDPDWLHKRGRRSRGRLFFPGDRLLPWFSADGYTFYLQCPVLWDMQFGNGGLGIHPWHQCRKDASAVYPIYYSCLAVADVLQNSGGIDGV